MMVPLDFLAWSFGRCDLCSRREVWRPSLAELDEESDELESACSASAPDCRLVSIAGTPGSDAVGCDSLCCAASMA